MQYYRKSTTNNNKEDIKLLNNHVNTIYNKLNNYIDERDNLLSLFNNRINEDIPDENILYENIDVNPDDKFKEIFLCKSKPSNIYKYVFHIFIKSDYNNINLRFIINNVDITYDIFVNKFKYIKIVEKKFMFNKVENFKVYLKIDKPLTIMEYSSYEVLLNYHESTIFNNESSVRRLTYMTNNLEEKLKHNNTLIMKFILTNIKKDDVPIP